MKQTEALTDYQKQAIDFLKSTNTTFKSEYKKHDRYFPDDKESRDIYNITLKNDRYTYKFTFGQSISETGSHPDEYSVLACLQKYEVGTFENFCNEFGYDQLSKDEEFENLIKPHSENFRKAVKKVIANRTYKAVCKEWDNVSKLFNESELEQLREIN